MTSKQDLPIRVDEDEVEDRPFLSNLGQDFKRSSKANIDVLEALALSILDGDVSMLRIVFDARDLHIRRGLGKPNGGVASESSDLKDIFSVEQLAYDG